MRDEELFVFIMPYFDFCYLNQIQKRPMDIGDILQRVEVIIAMAFVLEGSIKISILFFKIIF